MSTKTYDFAGVFKIFLALERYQYCFVAGCFAAGGSFFGKMPSILKEHNIDSVMGLHTLPNGLQCYGEFILMKCLPIAIMILCNVLNWRYFLKALQMTEQTLTATVLTSASNYVVSFILACLIYNEPITLQSSLGASLIVAGLYFLCDAGGGKDVASTDDSSQKKRS